jgi:hypothetical protein
MFEEERERERERQRERWKLEEVNGVRNSW